MEIINVYKLDITHNLSVVLLLLAVVQCYPLSVLNTDEKPDLKEEMKFPNGTVVGKFAYTDKEGNPVQVKYYADEASYGVELNSIKIMNQNLDSQKLQLKPEEPFLKSSDPVFDPSTNLLNSVKYTGLTSNKNKASDPSLEPIDKDNNKKQDSKKTNPDYDIYLQTDVSVPKKCNQQKVRVYNFGIDKRKIRNAYNMYDDASKICEQF